MTHRPHREFVSVLLVGVAAVAAWASVWAEGRTDCDESGTLAFVFIGLGSVALIGATRVIDMRLRWGIALTLAYALVVYVVVAAHAIGDCTG